MRKFLSIWNPAIYHGFGRAHSYFEGWFFKNVTKDERNALAVIPGVSIADDSAASHAFVMVSEAATGRMTYFKHPLSAFRADRRKFEIRIGASTFSLAGMTLDLTDGRTAVRGRFSFGKTRPWPVRLLSPGIMGWYAFVPSMECYHGVLSLDHGLGGEISIDERTIDFTQGKGYCEKDWGVSMPAAWVWMQSNHFDRDDISLTGSIAKIPWRGSFFTGFIFGFLLDGRLFRFTTYSGAKVESFRVESGKIVLRFETRAFALDIEAERRDGVELSAPSLGAMTARIRETLNSRVEVKLFDKTSATTVFAGTGRCAGLECVGDMNELNRGLSLKK